MTGTKHEDPVPYIPEHHATRSERDDILRQQIGHEAVEWLLPGLQPLLDWFVDASEAEIVELENAIGGVLIDRISKR